MLVAVIIAVRGGLVNITPFLISCILGSFLALGRVVGLLLVVGSSGFAAVVVLFQQLRLSTFVFRNDCKSMPQSWLHRDQRSWCDCCAKYHPRKGFGRCWPDVYSRPIGQRRCERDLSVMGVTLPACSSPHRRERWSCEQNTISDQLYPWTFPCRWKHRCSSACCGIQWICSCCRPSFSSSCGLSALVLRNDCKSMPQSCLRRDQRSWCRCCAKGHPRKDGASCFVSDRCPKCGLGTSSF